MTFPSQEPTLALITIHAKIDNKWEKLTTEGWIETHPFLNDYVVIWQEREKKDLGLGLHKKDVISITYL